MKRNDRLSKCYETEFVDLGSRQGTALLSLLKREDESNRFAIDHRSLHDLKKRILTNAGPERHNGQTSDKHYIYIPRCDISLLVSKFVKMISRKQNSHTQGSLRNDNNVFLVR